MRLTRVHVGEALERGELLTLPEAAGAHLVRVLRLTTGARIAVFDGAGHEYFATIARARGMHVEVEIGESRASRAESPLGLTLLQGISRAERMDWTVQKATELGVTRVVPLKTDHAVVKLDAASAEKKRQHWLSVASSAAEQCGRSVVPQIDLPLTLAEHIAVRRAQPSPPAGVVLDPDAAGGLRSLAPPPAGVALLIGPEGGLSDAELRLAAANDFAPVRLGPRVLRTETAALAALTALQTLHGDFVE